jgi:hypothetical protein
VSCTAPHKRHCLAPCTHLLTSLSHRCRTPRDRQGTNAHALLRVPAAAMEPAAAATPAAAPVLWRRAHTWAAPLARLLVTAALPSSAAAGAAPRVILQCRLDGAAAAWLQDNRIGGRAWLATSAVLEIAAEAASLAVAAAAGPAAPTVLAGCVLPSGLPLGGGGGGGAAADVRATLHAAKGLVEVQAMVAAAPGAGGGVADSLQRHQHALLFASLQAPAPAPAPAPGAAGGTPGQGVPLQLAASPAARLAAWLFGAAPAAAAGAFAGVDAAAARDPGGLVLAHPCALEAALQLEGAATAASGPAAPDQTAGPEETFDDVALFDEGRGRREWMPAGAPAAAPAAAAPIQVPASIGAVWIEGVWIEGVAAGGAGALSVHAAPGHGAGRGGGGVGTVSSVWLAAQGGRGGGCKVVDAEFRPIAQQVGVGACERGWCVGPPGLLPALFYCGVCRGTRKIRAAGSRHRRGCLGQTCNPGSLPCNGSGRRRGLGLARHSCSRRR